jgi:hypothetical protein
VGLLPPGGIELLGVGGLPELSLPRSSPPGRHASWDRRSLGQTLAVWSQVRRGTSPRSRPECRQTSSKLSLSEVP